MKKNELIKAWKNAENELNQNSPVNVDKELMSQINGGYASGGFVCSLSAECRKTEGKSCWGQLGEYIWG